MTSNKPLSQNRLHLAAAVLLPLVSFVVVLLFFGIKYEVNDDAIMSSIASGAITGHTERLIYTNIIIGYILKAFYFIIPAVNWYTIVQLVAVLCSFAVLCYIAVDRLSLFYGCILGGIFMIMVGFDILMWFQYSKNAAVLAVTGIVVLRLSLETQNKKKALIGMIVGGAIAVFGSLIRFESFAAVGAMSIPFLLMGINKSNLAKRAVAVALMVLSALALEAVDVASYKYNDEWSDYYYYNEVRESISDHKIYETSAADAAQFGLNDNEYALLFSWNFYDQDIFPIERLAEIDSLMPTKSLTESVKDTAYTAVHMLYKSPPFLFLGLLLFAFLFFTNHKKSLFFFATFGMLGVLLFYLISVSRLPHRVEIILVFSTAIFSMLCFVPKENIKISKSIGAFALCASLLMSAGHLEEQQQILSDRAAREASAEHYDLLSADKDSLYIVDTSHLDRMMGYDIFKVKPKDYFSNIVFLGSWYSRSVFSQEVLQAYGQTDPYPALLQDKVFLVGEYLTKQAHLQQYYDPNVMMVEDTQRSTPSYEISDAVFNHSEVSDAVYNNAR